jgi:hypothetical protein
VDDNLAVSVMNTPTVRVSNPTTEVAVSSMPSVSLAATRLVVSSDTTLPVTVSGISSDQWLAGLGLLGICAGALTVRVLHHAV